MTSTPRPTRLTETMRQAASEEMVADLINSHELEENQRESAIRDVFRYAGVGMDGYEIAKVLDDRCHWDCDLAMAEALDGFEHIARKQIDAAQRAWFEAEQPEPPAEPGQRIEFTWGGEPYTGIICEVFAHGVAQFTVKIDGDTDAEGPSQRRAIVNWENCKLVSA